MKWFKKIIRAILNLLPIFAFFFIVNGDSFALKHDYTGYSLGNSPLPSSVKYNNETGKYYFDKDDSNSYAAEFGSSSFSLSFRGDVGDNIPDSLMYSAGYLSFSNSGEFRNVYPIFSKSDDGLSIYVNPQFYEVNYLWNGSLLPSNYIRFHHSFGSGGLPQFNFDSIPSAQLIYCTPLGQGSPAGSNWNNGNGAVCPGSWNLREYAADSILPYPYSYDGFYNHSNAVSNSTGETITHTFALSNIFRSVVPRFSRLQIPMSDMEYGYFYDSSNLYSGRHFDFNGAFKFDGSFSWHDDIQNTGHFAIHMDGLDADTGQIVNDIYDCVVNEVLVTGLHTLEYSCAFDLEHNYLYVNPSLVIQNHYNSSSANSDYNYVWDTDNQWYFYNSFLTTDYDETPGHAFNEHITGGGVIPGDASNEVPACGSNDIFCQLNSVFVFGFPMSETPIGGLMNGFTDSDSCVNIPLIASMIHSNEERICPWFDSWTRSIVTPVLSLFAIFLVFGFFVRWLKSSSGDDMLNSKGDK